MDLGLYKLCGAYETQGMVMRSAWSSVADRTMGMQKDMMCRCVGGGGECIPFLKVGLNTFWNTTEI